MLAPQQPADHILRILGRLFHAFWPFLFLAVGVGLRKLRVFWRRFRTGAARDWPTVSASIDVVTVVEQILEGNNRNQTTGFVATLTYFYRNPELQMGEYERLFPLFGVGQRWADQFKGRQVLVHVSPRDPADSVLLESELDGITLYPAPGPEDAIHLEKLPQLSRAAMVMSGVAELMSLAGLVACVAEICLKFVDPKASMPVWEVAVCVAMLVFSQASIWFVTRRGSDSTSFRAFLRSYTLWCPLWMQWAVKLEGFLAGMLWLLALIAPDLPVDWRSVAARIVPFAGCIWGSWAFLTNGAMHAALLRTQESYRPETDPGAGLDPKQA